jgi:hypothetical protein
MTTTRNLIGRQQQCGTTSNVICTYFAEANFKVVNEPADTTTALLLAAITL